MTRELLLLINKYLALNDYVRILRHGCAELVQLGILLLLFELLLPLNLFDRFGFGLTLPLVPILLVGREILLILPGLVVVLAPVDLAPVLQSHTGFHVDDFVWLTVESLNNLCMMLLLQTAN